MAKRTLVRGRRRVRLTSAARGRAASPAPARPSAPAKPRKRGGPIPGTPSPLRITFAPDVLADCRRRYEETAEPATAIARDLGVEETTIRRLAKRERWVKFAARPVDLLPAVRLQRRAEALAAAYDRDRHPEVAGEAGPRRMNAQILQDIGRRPSRLAAAPLAPQDDGEGACAAQGGLRPPPQGDEESQEPGTAAPEEIASAPPPPAFPDTIDGLHAELRAQLAGVRALRERMKNEPQRPADANKTAHTLNALAATVSALLRAQARLPATGSNDDDIPRDLDALRDALARRIDAIFAEPEDARADAPVDDAGAAPA